MYKLKNGSQDSPSKNCTTADENTEDGSEDDLDCDEEPPYRLLIFLYHHHLSFLSYNVSKGYTPVNNQPN